MSQHGLNRSRKARVCNWLSSRQYQLNAYLGGRSIQLSASLGGRQLTERLQGQALKQSGSRNPLDRVSTPKRLAEGGYGEACAEGSCFEGSSTKRGLDLAESSLNSPN